MKSAVAGVAALALLVIAIGLVTPGPINKVVFLDVGQGDAILVQAGTQQILLDGGQGTAVLHQLGRELPWFDRRLEVVIATHPDRDHLEGLLHVLERYDVGLVLLPQMPHTSQLQDAWLNQLRDLLDQRGVTYRFAWHGQRLRLSEDVTLRIIGPFAEGSAIVAPGGKTNNGAVLARLDYGELSFLLTSDAESTVERMLVARAGEHLDVDIIKAGHHGSKTSTTQELIEASTPSGVVVSLGAENRFGHPHPTVMERIAHLPVWRTDQHGAVTFIEEAGRWFVKTAKAGQTGN